MTQSSGDKLDVLIDERVEIASTDTNQASEERIRGKLLSAYLDGRFSIEEIGKLTDKQAESVDRVIDRAIKLIRTEKLKLLAELRERVIGEDEVTTDFETEIDSYDAYHRNKFRAEQRNKLTKLEAEL